MGIIALNGRHRAVQQKDHLFIVNAELLDLDGEVGDYVIVHELLHFLAPNHDKLWKSLMRAHLGDYERQEERLRKIAPRVKGEW